MSGASRPSSTSGLPTTEALLLSDTAARRAELDPSIVDVSHAEGIPVGTLGSGHSVFGRNGFSRVAFSAPPDTGPGFDALRLPADFAFFLSEGDVSYALQEQVPAFRNASLRAGVLPVERVFAYAELPKAHYRFERTGLDLDLVMTAFSPLVAHDVETSSLPVQVFDVTLLNRSSHTRALELRLAHVETLVVQDDTACLGTRIGHIRFAAVEGAADPNGVFFAVKLAPGERRTVRFLVTWYFPEFRTPSPAATATYRRHYAARFKGAMEIVRLAERKADEWSRCIDSWRASFDVPPEMKRLWFSSLSSVITSTMLGDEYFFAIESPHDWVNTMDVAVYANWVYLVNWPELERLDLDQYLRVIPLDGENAGFVLHSLWVDAAHYAEEPTFLTRLWRAHLWFNDERWLAHAAAAAEAAASYARRHDSFEHLLSSQKGNQSYDEWMMPGASSYVNVAWLYALHALSSIGRVLVSEPRVGDVNAKELVPLVRAKLVERLWSEETGCFRCFHRTPGASDASVEETVFTDQLFGRWVLLVDETSHEVLSPDQVRSALLTVYENNLVEDTESGFRGWANGMLPGRRPDVTSGYHARTCWLGAELDLASLLGSVGEEAKSLDVFRAIEKSLRGNHLAVGEWNRSVAADGRVVVNAEWGKDTPRFPPYPRYTSCWEYLIRILGLSLDKEFIYLRPFKTLAFALRKVELAGSTLSIRVEPGWSRVVVDGREASLPAALARDMTSHDVRFLKASASSEPRSGSP